MSGIVRVLHVDGDPETRRHVAETLESRGVAVEAVPDTETGLERLERESFDCVVSDTDVPGLDGIEFLHRVRERWDGPFVLFTRSNDESLASRALAAGATDYVLKHEDDAVAELATRIRRSVSSWRSARALERRAIDYRLVAEHLPNTIVFLFDEAFRYRFAAGASLASLGLDADDVEGRTLAEVASSPEQYEFLAERYDRVLDGERLRFEHEVRDREFETRLVPIAESDAPIDEGPLRDPNHVARARDPDADPDPDRDSDRDPDTTVAVDGVDPVRGGGAGASTGTGRVPGGRGRGRGDGEEPERRSGADGETVRFGLGVAIDVTERNERIRELRRFETIVERMHESAFVVDRELRLQYANPSSLYWSDADLDAIRGTNVMTLAERMIVEDGTGASVEEFERTLRAVLERSPPDAPFPFADDWPDPIRLQLDLPTGEPVVEYHVAPVTDGEGGVVGVVVIGRDVTEQARRERELERQAERLRQFVDVASHDVRTPLSTARGWLELGREAIAEGDDPTTAFDRVASALDRTQRILDDASDLALADAPVDELALETVDLAEIARTAWTDVAAPPDVATLAVETSARVRADRLRLRRLIENLLRNGVEHGSRVVEGTDDPTAPAGEADAPDADSTDAVHLTVGELPDGTGFYVADDGPGVPARDRERVLEHGYTTRTGGTGYGLTIVSGIADAHGWSIAVTESETGGARFEIRGVEVVRDDETGESEGAVGDDDGDDDETGVQ